jgi:formylglycine-generating enzyme required for sulfatase activity
MVQVYIPAGKFVMGAADSDPYAKANERPRHTVILDAFWVDRTEVTNAMFTSFVTATGYKTQAERNGQGYAWTGSKWELTSGTDWQHPNGPTTTLAGLDNHPVVQMSWVDVQAYCQWAGRRPITEAEWEKAARGTDGQRYPWGNQLPAGTLLNFADRNLNTDWADKKIDDGYELTAPVGSYPDGASPYGVLDMAGNAWEWVADWDGEYAYSIQTNPTGPLMGTQKILRGGSWYDRMEYVRAAYRPPISLDATYSNMGFRCAASEKK